jgi:YD repeat-containing protein
LTRDTNGNVTTATVEGEATWTFSRDANGRVTGLTNGVKNVVVNRDGSGAVAGTSVTDL